MRIARASRSDRLALELLSYSRSGRYLIDYECGDSERLARGSPYLLADDEVGDARAAALLSELVTIR